MLAYTNYRIQTGMRFLEFVIISIWGNAFRHLVVSGKIDNTSRSRGANQRTILVTSLGRSGQIR